MSFYTVKEVAQMLKMSESLVYQLVESGKIRCHRIGHGRGRIRIADDDLTSYISDCRDDSICQKPVLPRHNPRLKHLKL